MMLSKKGNLRIYLFGKCLCLKLLRNCHVCGYSLVKNCVFSTHTTLCCAISLGTKWSEFAFNIDCLLNVFRLPSVLSMESFYSNGTSE